MNLKYEVTYYITISMKDQIFDDKSITAAGLMTTEGEINKFSFTEQVSLVFDDMVSRSIPGYDYVQDLTANLVQTLNLTKDDIIYDLGCSTGTSLLKIAISLETKPKLVGIDTSAPMIKRAKEKSSAFGLAQDIEFLEADILNFELKPAKCILSHYTIQFIEPSLRAEIFKNIYNSLIPGGYFLFSEKVFHNDIQFENFTTKHYYDFKERNGYSKLEIMRKRQALENVLRPYTTEQNLAALRDAGFNFVDIVSKQLCFVTFVAKRS